MKALYILAVALLILFLLGQVRVGGMAEYSIRGLEAWVRLGVFNLRVFPRKEKETEKKAKPPKQNKPQSIKEEQASISQKLGGALPYARDLLKVALEAAGKLYHKLQVDKLFLELTVGAENPADAALRYGQANGILGAIWYPLNQVLHVKDGNARVRVDFDARETTLYGSAALSLKIGQIVRLGLHFGWKALKAFLTVRREQKSKQQQRKAA